jgi:signal transduction histidine kinase
MLHTFLTDNRDELVKRARDKVASRAAPKATREELASGVPKFLDQLAQTLRHEGSGSPFASNAIGTTAALHGKDLLRMGFTIEQVVHDYGDVCQAITELALDRNFSVTTSEFHTLNRCLDNAIAGAVTEWERQREADISREEVHRLGALALEQRNLLTSALLAFQMLKKGTVAMGGSTGAVLGRSLERLRNINNHSLAAVRLATGIRAPVRISLTDLVDDEEMAASMDAAAHGLELKVERPEGGLAVEGDRLILGSVLTNLLQNAIKFTPEKGEVVLRVRQADGRVLLEIEDQCGGLQPGKDVFKPFDPLRTDGSGLGLGLSVARDGVEASGGKLHVRDLPGHGCIFTIDLPAAAPLHG